MSKEGIKYSYKHKLSDKINWGKYRNLTVRQLIIKDISYMTWLYYKNERVMFDLDNAAFRAMEWMINWHRLGGKVSV